MELANLDTLGQLSATIASVRVSHVRGRLYLGSRWTGSLALGPVIRGRTSQEQNMAAHLGVSRKKRSRQYRSAADLLGPCVCVERVSRAGGQSVGIDK